ncbi:TrkA C-terminal domain-containing protein [Ramlibacter sp. PS3R-8]|uniref:aspartate:alanine exchanger family transporter n=1 Tax=Ramlibacter sp. PS3R-8 TaxID=3133437 RepID=UPI0030A7D1C1
MDWMKELLEQQPLMTLFLTVAIGYLVGEINIKGFSLGVGAVLFVALAIGWFAPKAVPAPMVGTLGLALFLYAVGVQYGKQFFQGLTSSAGQKANLIALAGVAMAGVASLLIARMADLELGYAIGLFAGSSTSTPALQAALATMGNDDPAVGYSVSYPFGVAGPILLLYFTFLFLKPKIDTSAGSGMEMLEVAIRNQDHFGRTLGEVMSTLPPEVKIVALRTGHHNEPAAHGHFVAENDVVLLVAPRKESLEMARQGLGEAAPGRLLKDRSDLDYIRVFASRANVVGKPIGDLILPGDRAVVIAQVRRGDTNILPRPDMVLEFGDRVGMLAHRNDFAALRHYFGDSIKGTAEFSYISIGLGMALGFVLGAIQFPLPGVGKLSIGLAGVLVMALILGNLRRTGGLNWTIPLSANLVLRNLGLTLFLAQVGMSSGPKFAATVAGNGLQMLVLGAIVLAALIIPIMVLGLLVFKLPYDEVAGIVSGACGNPAVLAYSNKLTPTDRPDLAYAMIFPGMTIVKILFVDIVPALWR